MAMRTIVVICGNLHLAENAPVSLILRCFVESGATIHRPASPRQCQ
jgi:hypothetical protein